MDLTSLTGTIAGTLTTIAFIPQIIKVITTKSTKDISLLMFLIFTFGVLSWMVYGFLTDSPPIIIANAVVFVFAIIILAYKIRYN